MDPIRNVYLGELFFALFLMSGFFKGAFVNIPFDLTLLFLVLSGLSALRRFFLYPRISRELFLPIAFYFALASWICLSYYYSTSHIYALEKMLKFIFVTGWAYFGVFFLIKSKNSLLRFLHSLAFISLGMAIFAVYTLYVSISSGVSGFVGVSEGNYLGLGRSAGIGSLIFIILYILGNTTRFIKAIGFVGVLLTSTSLLGSGSRMPLISLLLLIGYLFIASVKYRSGVIYVRKGFTNFLAFILISSFAAIGIFSTGAFDTVMHRLEVLLTEENGGASAAARIERYETAMDMWSDHPILGEGIGSFPLAYSDKDQNDYPHNIFLEFMSELGIVGLLLFLGLLLASVYYGTKVQPKNLMFFTPEQSVLILVMGFLLINANSTGDINDNRMLFTFISLLFSSSELFNKQEVYKIDT